MRPSFPAGPLFPKTIRQSVNKTVSAVDAAALMRDIQPDAVKLVLRSRQNAETAHQRILFWVQPGETAPLDVIG